MNAGHGIRLLLLGAIWGSSFLFTRIAAADLGPASLIGVRLGLAALFLASIALATRRSLPVGKNWRHYLFIGAVNSAAPFFLFAFAAQTLPASILSLFNSLAPLCGAVIAAIWLRTPITRRVALGLALGMSGVATLTLEQITSAHLEADLPRLTLSLAAAFFAPVLYGIAATYLKRNAFGGQPFDNAHGSMWAASLLAAPFAIGFAPPVVSVPVEVWSAAIALGLLCTGVAYLLQFRLIADLGPTRALTVSFLIPVFGVLWGVLFLQEPVTLYLLAGGLQVLAGMYFTVVPSTRPAMAKT